MRVGARPTEAMKFARFEQSRMAFVPGTWFGRSPSSSAKLSTRSKRVSSTRRRIHGMRPVAVLSPQRTEVPGGHEASLRNSSQGSVAFSQKKRVGRGPSPVLHTSGDKLEDTLKQKVIVGVFGFACAVELAMLVIAGSHGVVTALLIIAGLQLGYIFADFGSGVYHWALDNYGDVNTPVFGYQIDAFQGHHRSPWTITKRGLCNNISRSAAIGLPFIILTAILTLPLLVKAFIFSSTLFGVLAQEFHKWAHSVEAPPLVAQLMRMGIIVSRREHGKHHHEPFHDHYCIVNGWSNGFLDRIRFFRRAEALVYKVTGEAPICWSLDSKLRDEALSL